MGQIVDAFNAANPNVKVTMTTQADYMTQLQTAAASDTLPDMTVVNEDVVGTAAFRNIIRPMDDIVKTDRRHRQRLPEGGVECRARWRESVMRSRSASSP